MQLHHFVLWLIISKITLKTEKILKDLLLLIVEITMAKSHSIHEYHVLNAS